MQRVRAIVRDGLSVYRVDGEALKALAPDVIVTQDHCEVCAVSLSDVEAAICTWTGRPVEIVSLEAELHGRRLRRHRPRGGRAGDGGGWDALVGDMQRRLDAVSARVAGRARPRVAFIEWVEPLMAGGNWMPELIEIAGGHNLFGQAGKHSDWMQWDELVAADPEVIVAGPCGYGLERCLQELPLLEDQARLGGAVRRARGPRLLRRRQRLLQSPRPPPRRQRRDAGGDAASGGGGDEARGDGLGEAPLAQIDYPEPYVRTSNNHSTGSWR